MEKKGDTNGEGGNQTLSGGSLWSLHQASPGLTLLVLWLLSIVYGDRRKGIGSLRKETTNSWLFSGKSHSVTSRFMLLPACLPSHDGL